MAVPNRPNWQVIVDVHGKVVTLVSAMNIWVLVDAAADPHNAAMLKWIPVTRPPENAALVL